MLLAAIVVITSLHSGPLKTQFTMPSDARGPQPLIFFVGWLSCDSILYDAEHKGDGFSKFVVRTIKTSGYATFRVDKPEPCQQLDFQSELAAYQEAFEYAIKLPQVDPSKVVIVGLSNGGGFAPLVAQGHPVAAYVSIGGWGRTWLEHMLELERERLQLSGKTPTEVNEQLRLFPEFYVRYLVRREKPGDVIQSDARFKKIWYDAPDSQYGRPAAFFQQLQALDLEREWSRVRVPTLVIRGEYDWIMSRNDAAAIANASHGQLMIRPRMDHFLDLHANYANSMNDNAAHFDDALVGDVIAWLHRVVK